MISLFDSNMPSDGKIFLSLFFHRSCALIWVKTRKVLNKSRLLKYRLNLKWDLSNYLSFDAKITVFQSQKKKLST